LLAKFTASIVFRSGDRLTERIDCFLVGLFGQRLGGFCGDFQRDVAGLLKELRGAGLGEGFDRLA
jgi:hypothetical protein